MIKNKNIFWPLAVIMVSGLLFFAGGRASAQPNPAEGGFDPDYIIGDLEIFDSGSMSLEEIRQFLNSKGGYLASYKTAACTEEDVLNQRPCSGPTKTAAEIIYDRAITNKINPKFLIVLLQKEQSLIDDPSPKSSQLDWAVGYGCFDNEPCRERFRGFWKQLNSATLQFRDYMESPQLYNYKAGATYTVYNTGREPSLVRPANQATAALYNYTPHVYNGNYNFYKIWQRYFTRSYPNGTLLQVEGDPGVWLIQAGRKRPFTSRGALTSRYDPSRIIKVAKSELDKYPTGAPIKFPQYSLVRSPRGTIFLIVDDAKRGFVSMAAFRKNGFNPEEVIEGGWDDLNAFRDGASITATTTQLTGTLMQNKLTGGVYWVQDGVKAPLLDAIFLKTKFKGKIIVRTDPKQLDKYPTAEPVTFGDGELLKSDTSQSVYVIADGKKNPITSGELFEKLGYKWENIITVSPKLLYLYPEGPALVEINGAATATTTPETSTATTTVTVNN